VVCRYRTGDLVIGGMTWEPCPWCGRTLPRIASTLRRASEQHALDLTKIKGTLVDLSHMGTLLSEMAGVEEWQIVISKKDDDPLELDQLEVRLAAREGVDQIELERTIARELLQATEVAPNKVSFHSLTEMLAFLGLETQTKESRYLDRRPK
jgi:phenylacetate-coenzyme A ligase PaaK-like adenylate-forming protein